MAVFGGLIALALLGVFGSGPLSHASAGGARDGVSIDYQRFRRFGEDTDLALRLPGAEGTSTMSIDRD